MAFKAYWRAYSILIITRLLNTLPQQQDYNFVADNYGIPLLRSRGLINV